MKQETQTMLLVILALALVGGVIFALWQIGAETVKVLAFLLIGAASLPIRAWRKNDNPPVIEKHVYHEGRQIIRERVIDGRPAVLQLPAPAQPYGVFPELLRASYQAGALSKSAMSHSRSSHAAGGWKPSGYKGKAPLGLRARPERPSTW